jgi:hypothetical protein
MKSVWIGQREKRGKYIAMGRNYREDLGTVRALPLVREGGDPG